MREVTIVSKEEMAAVQGGFWPFGGFLFEAILALLTGKPVV
jgi:hypothetical protein